MRRMWSFFFPIWSAIYRLFFSTLNNLRTLLYFDGKEDIEHSGKAVEASPGNNSEPLSTYPHDITYICVSRDSSRTRQQANGAIIYVAKGEILAWGGTAVLERLPSGAVMKTPIPTPYSRTEEQCRLQNMRLEAQIYAIIGEHPRVPRFIHWDEETCCLTMEYLENGDLKTYFQENHQNITPQLRLQWSRQAAEALAVLHNLEVIHCDLAPRNFLLDSHLDLKIADFGGASLRGSEPSATPATKFRHPGYDWNVPPVFGDDLFSLGSLIYFIMTGSYPYEELSSDEVEKLYEAQQFPDLSSVACGTIIMECWQRQIDSAHAVHGRLMEIEDEHSPGHIPSIPHGPATC